MHELSIAESMMDIVKKSAAENEAQKVTGITVVVGNMSGVEADALYFCFDTVKAGTLAEGAELVIEETKAQGECTECGSIFEMERNQFTCPDCGEVAFPSGGDDLYIKSIEVE